MIGVIIIIRVSNVCAFGASLVFSSRKKNVVYTELSLNIHSYNIIDIFFPFKQYQESF